MSLDEISDRDGLAAIMASAPQRALPPRHPARSARRRNAGPGPGIEPICNPAIRGAVEASPKADQPDMMREDMIRGDGKRGDRMRHRDGCGA